MPYGIFSLNINVHVVCIHNFIKFTQPHYCTSLEIKQLSSVEWLPGEGWMAFPVKGLQLGEEEEDDKA